jgi:hypothetical protein
MKPLTNLAKGLTKRAILTTVELQNTFMAGKKPQNSAKNIAKHVESTRKYVQTKGPSKTFQQDGHWIEKTDKTPILICECGNRYLKTRPGQKICLRCLSAMR